jgi:imidazolonepropionase-like amidohydrolase
MRKIERILLCFLAVGILAASCVLTAWAQAGSSVLAIRGGTIHTLTGPPIENGTVLIRGGRIAAVGTDVQVPTGTEVIDATGLHVYPGLFDPLSRLGLTEVGQVSATVDISELGEFNPQLVAAEAVHPASEHIPVARANGITHAVSAPGGSTLAGQASLIHLDGWTVEEMLIVRSVGLVVDWPSVQTRTFDPATSSVRERPFAEVKKEYDKKVADLEDWLEAAQHYGQAVARGSAEKFERDRKLEALVPVVEGRLPVIVLANRAREIRDAVAFAQRNKLKLIIAGGEEAWKEKELLKENNVPVILRPTQALPGEEDEPYDKPFTNPGELHRAGIRIAFATFNSSDSRTLPYEAANAVPYGLPYEEALKGVTLYPAQMLGVADRLGSLEVGKLGNLIVTDGDPLEITTQIRHVVINGRPVSTDNKHRQLYEKYRARP